MACGGHHHHHHHHHLLLLLLLPFSASTTSVEAKQFGKTTPGLLTSSSSTRRGPGLVRSPLSPPAPMIKSEPPRSGVLPKHFDWRNVNGTSYVTAVRNQFLPQWCGSCWSQAVTSSLSDRLKISRLRAGTVGPDVDISPQPLLDCAARTVGSCEGGDDLLAYEWIAAHGIEDTTCSPYRASDNQCFGEKMTCRICHSTGVCSPVPNPTRYWVEEHGGFQPVDGETSNETSMMYEIMHRGPISCSIYDDVETFQCYNGTGVIDAPPTTKPTTHVISLVGFGEEEDEVGTSNGGNSTGGGKYWIGRHSGGVYWGDDGFFRLRRGSNTLRIEEFCYWGTLRVQKGEQICTD